MQHKSSQHKKLLDTKTLKDSDLVKKRKARVQVDKLKRLVGEKKVKRFNNQTHCTRGKDSNNLAREVKAQKGKQKK